MSRCLCWQRFIFYSVCVDIETQLTIVLMDISLINPLFLLGWMTVS